MGRPKDTGNKYISLSELVKRFPSNYCIPLPSSFIEKYNLLGEKIETELCKTKENPLKPNQVQIQEINLNE